MTSQTSAELTGKIALVTGAARNIGRAPALALANAGAHVALNVKSSAQEAAATRDEIRSRGDRAEVFQTDISVEGNARAMIDDVVKRFGRIDTERTGQYTSVLADRQQGAEDTFVGRRGYPQEVAAMICHLCGPNSAYVTGQTIHVNGGLYLT